MKLNWIFLLHKCEIINFVISDKLCYCLLQCSNCRKTKHINLISTKSLNLIYSIRVLPTFHLHINLFPFPWEKWYLVLRKDNHLYSYPTVLLLSKIKRNEINSNGGDLRLYVVMSRGVSEGTGQERDVDIWDLLWPSCNKLLNGVSWLCGHLKR